MPHQPNEFSHSPYPTLPSRPDPIRLVCLSHCLASFKRTSRCGVPIKMPAASLLFQFLISEQIITLYQCSSLWLVSNTMGHRELALVHPFGLVSWLLNWLAAPAPAAIASCVMWWIVVAHSAHWTDIVQLDLPIIMWLILFKPVNVHGMRHATCCLINSQTERTRPRDFVCAPLHALSC